MKKPVGADGNILPTVDYKAKILLFLEMEKLKLVSEAVAAGIPESVC